MRRIRAYAAHCFRTGTVPRVDELARMLNMPRETLTHHFRRATGETPGAVIRALQLRRAMDLLTSTDRRMIEVARAAGYGSTRAFCRAFRRATAVSPSAYRARSAG